MISSRLTAAALAALLLTSGHAFATATASAQLSDLTITLGRISNAAGTAAPSVTFQSTSGSVVSAYDASDAPLSIVYGSNSGATFLGSASYTAVAALAAGTASLSGDAWKGSGAASATETATGSPVPGAGTSGGSSRVSFGDGGDTIGFTLGANTFMEISGKVTLAATVSPTTDPNAVENASSFLYFSLSGTNGINTQSSVSSVYESLQNYYGNTFEGTSFLGSYDVDIAFMGSRTAATTGVFEGAIGASTTSDVAAVPEPAQLPLMLVGLGACGLLARRRRAR